MQLRAPTEKQWRTRSVAAVELTEREFIKRQDPAFSALERIRTALGRKVAGQTGLFEVPRILSHDDTAGEIHFERLDGFLSFKEYVAQTADSRDLTHKVGRVLAAIHNLLQAPEAARTLAGDALGVRLRSAPIPLHGDFGAGNILVKRGTLDIIIVDWSGGRLIGTDVAIGPAALDLGSFLMSLFELRPLGPNPVTNPSAHAQVFLESYAEACTRGLDRADLKAVLAVLQPRYIRAMPAWRGVLGTLAHIPYAIVLHCFLSRFCSADSVG